MLALLTLWAILALIFTLIGMPIFHGCNLHACLHKPEDRLFVAIWLGMITFANLLLLTSLFIPLTLYVATFFVAIMMVPYYFKRFEILAARPSADFLASGVLIVVTILVAALAAIMSLKTPEDSGLYHIQMLSWLAKYGSVPGLALINNPFGYTNAWFALIAPLKAEWFQDHLIMGMNSFIFYMMIVQAIVKLHRVLNRCADIGDSFFIISCALFCRFFFPSLIFSPSPDLPVTLLIMATAWLIIVLSLHNHATQDSTGQHRTGLSVLILACGVVSIKIGAVPLLGVAVIYYAFAQGFSWRKAGIAVAITALFAAIHMLVSTVTSGCPLYPAPYFCSDLPWSLGADNAKQLSEETANYAKWVGTAPSDANGFNWLWHPSPNNNLYNDKPLMFGLLIANILCGAGIYLKRKTIIKDTVFYTALIAISGIAFTLAILPHLRFGLGFFLVIPSLTGAFLLLKATQPSSHFAFVSKKVMVPSILIAAGFSVAPIVKVELSNVASIKRIIPGVGYWGLFPMPPMQGVNKDLKLVRGNNFLYFVPSNALCWRASILCAPRYLDNVWLRDESKGFKSGFIKKPISR